MARKKAETKSEKTAEDLVETEGMEAEKDLVEEDSAKSELNSEKSTEKEKLSAKDKKQKLTKLLEKAKELEGSIKEEKSAVDLKKQLKDEPSENLLVPLEDYMKSSIHLGTRVITPDMKSFVYRRRADGLAIFNTSKVDTSIREGAEFMSKFSPENIIIVCKREAGWPAVKKISELTGIRSFTKKYPAGILTNSNLKIFTEADLILIADPWIDKNVLADALKIKIPVISICDTNNYTKDITKIIAGNNKSYKALGMIFYLLLKLYSEKRKLNLPELKIQDFVEDWDSLQPPQ